jgi:Heterokaryon incompatibility protein (HET)
MPQSQDPTVMIPQYLVHPEIDLSGQEIRLFELTSAPGARLVEGIFHIVALHDPIAYTALSYTWGDSGKVKSIKVGGKRLKITQNHFGFLHSWDTSKLERPSLFWIDAICIDQTNLMERNHQVGLMKKIYTQAAKVLVWLGQEADNSDLVMKYMATQASAPLKRRGCGYRRIWTRDEGRALVALCERGYWRRIWIIQEIIHARTITVLCGEKSFEWISFEKLYAKLKTLELENWILHHDFAGGVLHSSACVMVWQRAYWRHPQTPTPRLRTLLDAFQNWKCSDVRDMVYGLLAMIDEDSGVVVDYSKSVEDLYEEVHVREVIYGSVNANDYQRFRNLLRQVLKRAQY